MAVEFVIALLGSSGDGMSNEKVAGEGWHISTESRKILVNVVGRRAKTEGSSRVPGRCGCGEERISALCVPLAGRPPSIAPLIEPAIVVFDALAGEASEGDKSSLYLTDSIWMQKVLLRWIYEIT